MKDNQNIVGKIKVSRKCENLIKEIFQNFTKEDINIKVNDILFLFFDKNLLSNKFNIFDLFEHISVHLTQVSPNGLSLQSFQNLLLKISRIIKVTFESPINELVNHCCKDKTLFKDFKSIVKRQIPYFPTR